jgi:hypothetical protein
MDSATIVRNELVRLTGEPHHGVHMRSVDADHIDCLLCGKEWVVKPGDKKLVARVTTEGDGSCRPVLTPSTCIPEPPIPR